MKIYINHLLEILIFSSPVKRFEIKNALRRRTRMAGNISNLVALPQNFFHFYEPEFKNAVIIFHMISVIKICV